MTISSSFICTDLLLLFLYRVTATVAQVLPGRIVSTSDFQSVLRESLSSSYVTSLKLS